MKYTKQYKKYKIWYKKQKILYETYFLIKIAISLSNSIALRISFSV